MPAVFVNGNPETAAVWGPLLAELGRADATTLSPPGFGAPVPEGFGCTADEYLAWLITEVGAFGEPVDLVGHDWGGMHVMRLACHRPDLLRSWCVDVAGTFAQDYVWHEATLVWQTAGDGERAVSYWLGMGAPALARSFESLGMTQPTASVLAEAFDEVMGQSILNLYRSAGQAVLAQWTAELPAASARPGLVVFAPGDIWSGGEALHRWTAERTGAEAVVLDGLGHWWLLEDPTAGAAALQAFWDSL
jgi:pimeloyl-ACP methyl ester carboxylesterase